MTHGRAEPRSVLGPRAPGPPWAPALRTGGWRPAWGLPGGGAPSGRRAWGLRGHSPAQRGSQPKARAPAEGAQSPALLRCRCTPLARRALRGREEEGQSGNCLEENWVHPVSALDRLWAQGPEARGWGVRGDGDLEGSPGRAARVLAWRRCPRGLALAREGPGHSRGSCKRAPLLARAWKAPPTTEALAGASAHPWRPGNLLEVLAKVAPGPRTAKKGCPSVLGPNQPPTGRGKRGSDPPAAGVRWGVCVGIGDQPGCPCRRGVQGQAGGRGWAAAGGLSPMERDQQHKCHVIYMTKWRHYGELTGCRWGNFRKLFKQCNELNVSAG